AGDGTQFPFIEVRDAVIADAISTVVFTITYTTAFPSGSVVETEEKVWSFGAGRLASAWQIAHTDSSSPPNAIGASRVSPSGQYVVHVGLWGSMEVTEASLGRAHVLSSEFRFSPVFAEHPR